MSLLPGNISAAMRWRRRICRGQRYAGFGLSLSFEPGSLFPHARGTRLYGKGKFPCSPGSPSPEWGIPNRPIIIPRGFPSSGRRRRFIYTRVGYTLCSCCNSIVHFGSPPLVWGIRESIYKSAARIPVHPHSCGVYACILPCTALSPRFIPTRVGYTLAQAKIGGGSHGVYIPNRSAWVPVRSRSSSVSVCLYINSQSGSMWHSRYPE